MRQREPISAVLSAVVSAGLVAGCASHSYLYAPEGAQASAEGRPVTRILIPQEEPRGEVRVESFGMTTLEAASADRQIDALHVRLTVGNDVGAGPFTVDTREQLLEIRGQGRSRPIFVNTDRASLPIIEIPRREQRVLDLYYPLPATIDDAEDLGQFDLLWQVDTGARTVAERTPFGRIEVEPEALDASSLYAGWGAYWWYDPFYPRHSFPYRQPVIVRGPGPVVVR